MKISDVIKSSLKLKQKTIAELSEEIGIPEPTIYRLFKKDDYKLSTLLKISKFLEIGFYDLIQVKLDFLDTVSWPTRNISDSEISLRRELDINIKKLKQLEEQLQDKRQIIEFQTKVIDDLKKSMSK